MMSMIAAGTGTGVVNGPLEAMFNLQQSEISICHRHNEGERERERKGLQERERSEAPVFLHGPEYQPEKGLCERAHRSRSQP